MRKLYTIKESAALVEGVTEFRIRKLIERGILPVFLAGNKRLINEEDLYRAIQECTERSIKNAD